MVRVTTHLALLALSFLWLLGAAGPASAAPSDPPAQPAGAEAEQPSPRDRVGSVDFQGFSHFDRSRLLAVTETQPPDGLSLRGGQIFDELRLIRDQNRLVKLYHEYGFFKAQVAYSFTTGPDVAGVKVLFTAQEGPPTLVRQVELEFSDRGTERVWKSLLTPEIIIAKEQQFDAEKYQQSKENLNKALKSRSHIKAEVDGQVQVYLEDDRADIVFRVKPGPMIFFGPVEFQGVETLEREYLARRITFTRGQPYSTQALEESQNALMDTGFFDLVTMHPDLEEIKGNQAPVVVQVQERKRHSVRASAGWGPQDQMRLRLLQVNRNPLGLSDTLTFEGKYSSIYLGLVGTHQFPQLLGPRTNFLMRGGLEQLENEAYILRRPFANPTVEHRLAKDLFLVGGLRWERDAMASIKTDVPDPDFEKQTFQVISLPVGLRYDTRDSLLNPTQGTYANLELETSLTAWGSDLNFIRPVLELRHLFPLDWWPGWILAMRGRAGIVDTLGLTQRVPLMRRFFLGGADSVRGYPYQRLGPLDSASKPLGGESMLEGTVELRFPIYDALGGVLFVDAGQNNEGAEFVAENTRLSAGCGIRYNTPVGPLRLDFGYQLNPPDDARYSRYDIYLSVGQAF